MLFSEHLDRSPLGNFNSFYLIYKVFGKAVTKRLAKIILHENYGITNLEILGLFAVFHSRSNPLSFTVRIPATPSLASGASCAKRHSDVSGVSRDRCETMGIVLYG